MAEKATGFQEFLREEVNRTKGVYYPVRAGFLHRLTTRNAPVKALHPNPNDEFTFPDIGPNYEIISRYMQDYMRDVQFRRGYEESSILEPLYVQKAKPDGERPPPLGRRDAGRQIPRTDQNRQPDPAGGYPQNAGKKPVLEAGGAGSG